MRPAIAIVMPHGRRRFRRLIKRRMGFRGLKPFDKQLRGRVYTATMTLRSAAFLALIGMVMLTVLLLAGFVRDLVSFMRDVVPALRLLASFIYLFASLSLTVFLYVFHRSQS